MELAVKAGTYCNASSLKDFRFLTVEAASFEAALESVLPKLREEGLQVMRVEVDKEGLALLQEAT